MDVHVCPFCLNPISSESADMTQSTAWCPGCRKQVLISRLGNGRKEEFRDFDYPPRGVTEVKGYGEARVFRYKRMNYLGWVLMVAGTGFFVIGVYLFGEIFSDKWSSALDIMPGFMGLIFMAVSLLVFITGVLTAFGQHILTMDKRGGAYYCGLGRMGRTRVFRLRHDYTISLESHQKSEDGSSFYIVIRGPGGYEFAFGGILPLPVQNYFLRQLILMRDELATEEEKSKGL